MTHKKEQRGFSNFGFSTILLSFVMICVVTFSALSLVTAHSDYKLSKKVAKRSTDYYTAEERAYDKLTAIQQILIDSYTATADQTSYYESVALALSSYGELMKVTDSYTLSYEEPIADDQYLAVTLSILYPTAADQCFYSLTEWKSIYKTVIPEDDTLNLIQ